MQNFSHNGDAHNDDDSRDKSRKQNDIQRDIIMAEADLRKISQEKIALDAEIRALKKEDDRIRVTMQEKRARLSKVDYEITQAEAVVKALQKKLNLIN